MVAVGSREAAERVKREIEARLALGGMNALEQDSPRLPIFADYAGEWLKGVEHERKPSTAGFYGQYLRLYVLPKFGDPRLDQIRRDQAKSFIQDLPIRDLSKNTIRLAITTLRALLSAAVEDRLLDHNPAQGLGRFVKSEKAQREATSLTSAEVEQLVSTAQEAVTPGHYALILTALRAGLREGELAGLERGDIQFGTHANSPDRFILVQRTFDRRWSRTMLTPKSGKPRRVDMSRELPRTLMSLFDAKILKAFAAGRSEVSGELVFPSEADTPIEMNNFIQRTFKPLLTRAGLRDIRFHDLRHTFGSLLIQAGASLAYVRDQIGHSSIQVTVDIYGHLVPANISFVDRLDAPTSVGQSAMPPQCAIQRESNEIMEVFGDEWLGGRDSNPDTQIQSLQSYH